MDIAEVTSRAHSKECKERIRELAAKDPEFQAQTQAGLRRTGRVMGPEQVEGQTRHSTPRTRMARASTKRL